MANARARIRLTDEELIEYIDTQKTVIMGTINHDGYPHLVPMWYAVIDGLIHMHTYGKSQKVKNIEREPRGSVLIEDGVAYNELRGVYMRGRYEIRDDQDLCYRIGVKSAAKYQGLSEEQAGPGVRLAVRKRVAMIFRPEKISSWDHRKI